MHYRSGYNDPLGDSVFDAMGELVFVLSGDGTVLGWNDGAADVTGRSAEAFESMSFRDLFAESDRESIAAEFDRALDGDDPSTVLATLVTATGDRLPYELSLAALMTVAGRVREGARDGPRGGAGDGTPGGASGDDQPDRSDLRAGPGEPLCQGRGRPSPMDEQRTPRSGGRHR
jgi:PAS domain S-box-containing protein